MKVKNYIYMLMAAMTLTSCHLDVPEIPAEELYLRNFIKTFGLIDPKQDWNLAEQSDITVNLPSHANKVVVYGEIFGDYYRVARCYNAEAGVIVIPLDLPVNTTGLAVEVDGVAYLAELGGTLNVGQAQPVSRADDEELSQNIFLDEQNVLGWVIVAEDLGDTDDVDFNDFVARFSYEETSFYAMGTVTPDQWDVLEQQTGDLYFKDGNIIPSRAEGLSRAGETVVTIKALASGGILPIYLHYRYKSNNTDIDYIIGPGIKTSEIFTNNSEIANIDYFEWHSWFGQEPDVMINTADTEHLLDGDTRYSDPRYLTTAVTGASINFTVPTAFSFATYSQLAYESYNPMNDYDFNFNRHTVEGFYITVNSPAYNGNNPAYDLGKVIGHNRTQGLPPQMFIVPDLCYVASGENAGTVQGTKQDHFRWSTERTYITDSYPKFSTWVTTGNVSWYQFGREDQVVSDKFLQKVYAD